MSKERIKSIDALRGLCIVLMIAYHFGYDLVAFLGAPKGLIFNPLLGFLQPFFAAVFVFISGVSCRFSRSNVKRGIEMFLCGLLLSMVTRLFGSPAWFGILSFLGVAAILYAMWEHFVPKARLSDMGVLSVTLTLVVLFTVSYLWINGKRFDVKHLWWLGFAGRDFFSVDYFPLFPWLLVYAAGAVFGGLVAERKLPGIFYTADLPPLSFVGRNTLWIYLLHQPVLYGVVMLVQLLQRS